MRCVVWKTFLWDMSINSFRPKKVFPHKSRLTGLSLSLSLSLPLSVSPSLPFILPWDSCSVVFTFFVFARMLSFTLGGESYVTGCNCLSQLSSVLFPLTRLSLSLPICLCLARTSSSSTCCCPFCFAAFFVFSLLALTLASARRVWQSVKKVLRLCLPFTFFDIGFLLAIESKSWLITLSCNVLLKKCVSSFLF